MREVERVLVQVVSENVVFAHFDVRQTQFAKELWIHVGRHDRPRIAHLLRQPTHNRPAARADFQTPPTRSNPNLLHPPPGQRIAHRLQHVEPFAFGGVRVVGGGVCRVSHRK
jgi:hypothetical protein